MKNLTASDLDNSGTNDIKLDKTPPYGYSGHLDLTKAIITGELSQSPATAAKAAISTSQPQIPSAPQLKWWNQPTMVETKLATDPGNNEHIAGITTPPVRHDERQDLGIGSPTRSDLTVLTSWDEWDEPSDSVRCFDPMIVAEDRLAVQYDFL